MIDEKKLIRVMWDRYNEHYNNANRFSEEETEMAYRVLSDLQLTIENMPKVGEWIPCSERLPEKNKAVLVYVLDAYEIAYLDDAEDWIHCMGTFYKDEVEAWMPLPPAYKDGE